MSEDEEVEYIWNLATGRGQGWQKKDNPCVQTNKGDLRRAWKTAKKRVDTKTVELAMQAQARSRRADRSAGGFVPQPKGIGVWMRAEGWDDMIEPAEQKTNKEVNHCKCGKETHGPNFPECADCMGFKDGKMIGWEAAMMRDYFRRHPEIDYNSLKGLNQSQSVLVIRNLLSHKNVLLDK